MKEIPILMSHPMIQALLKGHKTQTRRKINHFGNSYHINRLLCDWGCSGDPYIENGVWYWELQTEVDDNRRFKVKNPYGKSGDILYVKEMHYAYGMWVENGYTKTGKQKWIFLDCTQSYRDNYCYFDNPPENVLPNSKRETYGWFKRNSLFMSKEACRIKLLVKDVRVERLQDITEADAIAEGIAQLNQSLQQILLNGIEYLDYSKNTELFNDGLSAKDSYQSLWESINGLGSWSTNPWVWRIEFSKL